jgi:signal transduction histidine kinase
MKASVRLFTIVLGAWTLAALLDGLATAVLFLWVGRPVDFWLILRRPLTEQWIWAALTPLVFALSSRFPLMRPHIARSLLVHSATFFLLCGVHCWIADLVGSPMAFRPSGYQGSLLALRFLEEIYSDIWMYWPLVCIRALLDSQALIRQRESEAARLELLLANAQTALLRAQIQPHFLFNTLHSITTLVRTDPFAAEHLIADLAQILRASFAEGAGQETALRNELTLVRCYLRIQERRFSDRLRVVWRIEPQAMGAMLPTLLLQSLVENAVIHGVAPLSRPTTIEIAARRADDRLQVEVQDDGTGLPADFTAGVGLSNARMRIEQLYGPGFALRLDGAPGQGTRAAFAIPYRTLGEGVGDEERIDNDPDADRRRRAACTA